jgi:hypothetical protein
MGVFSKTRTKRIIPPERKFANAMLVKESLRKIAGREAPEEKLQRQQIQKRALEDIEFQRRGRRRELGERGIEGPGFAETAARMEELATNPMIQAGNIAEAGRAQGAIGMFGTLLRENQPYTKTRTKKGFMSKAAPFVKMGGKIAGSIVGGIYGGAQGAEMGREMGGKPGEAMAEADKGGGTSPTTFGGTGGGTQTQGQQPPQGQQQGQQPLGTQQQGTTTGNKKGMMSGIQGMFNLFGG